MSDGVDEPAWGRASERIVAVLTAQDFDQSYYAWCRESADTDADELPAGAPAVREFIDAFRAAGATVDRDGRTRRFTVTADAGPTVVELQCELGRGINTLSPQLSVSVGGAARERAVSLSGLARKVLFARQPDADDPLYPYPIVRTRRQLDALTREIVRMLQAVARDYPA